MKKDLLLLLLLFLPIVANADSVGKCGANLTWTYVDATKTLTISGSGPMDNYACSACNPWVDTYKVSTLVIEEGVTTIGDNAFSHLSLTSVIIPSSVTTIGKTAFYGCSSLTSITIPNSVTAIYSAAFENCI